MAEPAAEPDTAAAGPAAPAYSPHAIHMLRTVQNNTLALSQMADQKASILMGATFLVFSITVSRAFTGGLPWSLGVLALFAFLSSLCAVLAVLPRLSGSLPPGVRRNKLFFGHFHDLEEEQWTADVLAGLHTDEAVFRAMLHDIYQNGQVLQHRKYRFLGYAYRLFVVGLVITLAAFLAELALAYA
ncbi:MAG TPA: Pycsar system effector family protein [Croceibacterium sp.]